MGWTDALIAVVPAMLVSAVLIGLERARGGAPGDMLRNLQCWGLQLLIGFTVLAHVAWPLHWSLLDGRRLPLWLGLAIFLIARDFGEYMFHRAQHRIPFLWSMHSLHHSDPDLNVSTTGRHFWLEYLLKSLTVYLAVGSIFKVDAAIASSYALLTFYNYFTHMDVRVGFGKFSWILNSPQFHRVHHSRLPQHYDCNFAGLLPVFDCLFGTYRKPEPGEFPPTGLDGGDMPGSVLAALAWPLRRLPPFQAARSILPSSTAR